MVAAPLDAGREPVPTQPARVLDRLLAPAGRRDRLTHVEQLPARPGRTAAWPDWVSPLLRSRLAAAGIAQPWEHQVVAAEHARAGRSVAVATGTSSGKSLAYLLPGLTSVLAGMSAPGGRGATVLYLAPTKALAADQLRTLAALGIPGLRAATFDGDTPPEDRDWVRDHAAWVLTNPDMLHRSLLPSHKRWTSFLRTLTYVVVDECHAYRGVFGSHVAQVLRRLRRICARHGAHPTFVLASATVSEPAASLAASPVFPWSRSPTTPLPVAPCRSPSGSPAPAGSRWTTDRRSVGRPRPRRPSCSLTWSLTESTRSHSSDPGAARRPSR